MNLPGDFISEITANHFLNNQSTDDKECVVVIPDHEYQKRMLHNTGEKQPKLLGSAIASTENIPNE